jgi:hypothetical protein
MFGVPFHPKDKQSENSSFSKKCSVVVPFRRWLPNGIEVDKKSTIIDSKKSPRKPQ